jgi:hypothetical protein
MRTFSHDSERNTSNLPCPVHEHDWIEAETVGWYTCTQCGAPGVCVGCLGRRAVALMPLSWGIRLLCPDCADGSDCLDGLDGQEE